MIKVDGTNNRIIFDAGTLHQLTLKSSPISPNPWILTFPTTAGLPGQALITDGNGVTYWGTTASGTAVMNDTTTAMDLYPLFSDVTSGTPTTIYTSDPKYLYNPAVGQLTSPEVAASNGIFLNAQDILTSYTFPAKYNGLSAGAVAVHPGAIVTVPPTSNWRVI